MLAAPSPLSVSPFVSPHANTRTQHNIAIVSGSQNQNALAIHNMQSSEQNETLNFWPAKRKTQLALLDRDANNDSIPTSAPTSQNNECLLERFIPERTISECTDSKFSLIKFFRGVSVFRIIIGGLALVMLACAPFGLFDFSGSNTVTDGVEFPAVSVFNSPFNGTNTRNVLIIVSPIAGTNSFNVLSIATALCTDLIVFEPFACANTWNELNVVTAKQPVCTDLIVFDQGLFASGALRTRGSSHRGLFALRALRIGGSSH